MNNWEDLCCEFNRLLKTEVLSGGNTRIIFSFWRLNTGFGHMPIAHWVQLSQLCIPNCSDDQKTGMSPHQVQVADQARICHTVLLAYSIFQGWGLRSNSTYRVVLWAEFGASQPGGFEHKARTPKTTAELTWWMLCFDSFNGSFPCNTISCPMWSCVQTKCQTLIWFKSSWLCSFHAYVY